MRILFVTEYFYPYIHGGAEVSVYQLAKKLVSKGVEICILTPNYGSLNHEMIEGANVLRFPWFLHLENYSDQLSPSFSANPLAWLFLTWIIFWEARKENTKIIHAHSVNFFPAVWLASKMLGIKNVVSIRDNQILCNYGWCLTKNDGKNCSLKDYFLEDFLHYYKEKIKRKGIISLFLNIIFAVTGRVRTNLLNFFVARADARICASNAQKRTLGINGIAAETIYNIFQFEKAAVSLPKNEILYATKLSEGKGLGLLLRSWTEVHKKFPNLILRIVGNGDRKFYNKLVKDLHLSRSVKFSEMPDFKAIREIRQAELLEVAPSIYPESFGRSALEAIALGVPVVASNRGGLVEIVEDGKYGLVVEPTEKELSKAIIRAVLENKQLRANIQKDYNILKQRFENGPTEELMKLYEKLI